MNHETRRLITKARLQAQRDGRLRFVYRSKIGLKQPKGWGFGTVYAVGADEFATIPEPGDKWETAQPFEDSQQSTNP